MGLQGCHEFGHWRGSGRDAWLMLELLGFETKVLKLPNPHLVDHFTVIFSCISIKIQQ